MANKLQTALAGLAMLTALPVSVLAQSVESETEGQLQRERERARENGERRQVGRTPRQAFDVQELSEEAKEARSKLEESISAIEELTSLTADARAGATEGLVPFMPEAEGKLLIRRELVGEEARRGINPFGFRVTGEGKLRASETESTEFDVISKGRLFYWLDDESREGRQRVERLATRDEEVRIAKELMMRDAFDWNPYAEAMRNADLELLEQQSVGGVVCDVVKSGSGDGPRHELYFIAVEDKLPRRIERVAETEVISGSVYVELANARIDPPIAEDALDLVLPEGFEADPSPSLSRNSPQVVSPDGTPSPRRARPAAHPWTLSSASGEEVSLEELGGNVVVFDFWGTWLPEDRRPVHEMQALADRFADQPVKVYSLNYRERDPDAAQRAMRDAGASYPLLVDADEVGRRYGVRQFPTIYIVGFEGEVVEVVRGYDPDSTFQNIAQTIDSYLQERQGASEGEAGGTETTTAGSPSEDG